MLDQYVTLNSIVMSRISYEPGEMKRFGFSFARLRLLALKYVQKKSLLNVMESFFDRMCIVNDPKFYWKNKKL